MIDPQPGDLVVVDHDEWTVAGVGMTLAYLANTANGKRLTVARERLEPKQ